MAGSVDSLTVTGISWQQAMESAAEVLTRAQELADDAAKRRAIRGHPEFISADVALAQAWIALAREITMHGRAIQ